MNSSIYYFKELSQASLAKGENELLVNVRHPEGACD